jgi:hypothetical protein
MQRRNQAVEELISSFEKNALEEVRVSLTEYRGHQLIDLRVYYASSDGESRPTKKGLALSVGLYPELKEALAKLEQTLKDRGLLEDSAA